ncbi:MAG TPA: acetyl-CoA C-acetyltransferase [Clostridiales bacterium]|nr:acetyl-CoA C-acetyltransferase [Clostridiales bacterium]
MVKRDGSDPVVVAAARTPFGAFGGALKDVPAVGLGGIAIRAALERAGVAGEQVDYALMGMVVAAGTGQVPSRQATLKAGLPVTVPSDTINKVCASSLRAVNLATALIRAGEIDIAVAGGMENMNQAPYLLPGGRWGHRLGHGKILDATIHDGLWCAARDVHMGNHGDAMAREFKVTREEQDAWAYRSHRRALAAMSEGRFDRELVPVELPQKKGPPVLVKADEPPRADTSLEKLAALRPAFTPDGTITAGNAPGINDGAAALVLMSRARAEAMGVRPIVSLVAAGAVSADAPYLATVPWLSAERAIERAGLRPGDMALVEINEAFAVVALVSARLGGWGEERVNVDGGAVALGHPIGASGARILMHLAFELQRRGEEFGVACICSGGGQGEATVIRTETA